VKTEVGRVYYLTMRLVFPHDKEEWIQQTHVPASTVKGVFFYIAGMKIKSEFKTKLCRDLECSWKQPDGVWIQLMIETQYRRNRWGNANQAKKLIGV
jgi:hypothetical protein